MSHKLFACKVLTTLHEQNSTFQAYVIRKASNTFKLKKLSPKRDLGCPTIFLDSSLHQQLKFSNSVCIVHAKRFVLINEFPADVTCCVAVRVNEWESGTAHCKMAAMVDYIQTRRLQAFTRAT